MLNEKIAEIIRESHAKLLDQGIVLPEEKLKVYYDTFKRKFGPERLSELDGEELLILMHDFSTRDSMNYWLEFKNDEEFPAHFGSIAGGSALKYTIYKRKDTGLWMMGSPQNQSVISVEEAIKIAENQRNQFVNGAKCFNNLPTNADQDDYDNLQNCLEKNAPDVSNTAWGHKYFSLIYPDKIDDYHNPYYQWYHLIKILIQPISKEQRYRLAKQYIEIARALGIHVNNLTTVLNSLHGEPHRYWILKPINDTHTLLDDMFLGEFVSLGWSELDDLSDISYNQESKNNLSRIIQEKFQHESGTQYPTTNEVFKFVTVADEGDLILICVGGRIKGICQVVGNYEFVSTSKLSHRRPVIWLSKEEWILPKEEQSERSFFEFKSPQNQIATEKRLLDPGLKPRSELVIEPSTKLSGIPDRIEGILQRKMQVILYGPPGTGKTYWAMKTAYALSTNINFQEEQAEINTGLGTIGDVRVCTFHPSYGYEDFIEGYRPEVRDGVLVFNQRNGIFKQLCEDARRSPESKFFLVIDEINRGDIPRIFGELITLLEKNKRDQTVYLPLSGEPFSVPKNLYVIGTMNTADRSIALLDTALRRRFGFIELMPDSSLLAEIDIDGIPLGPWLEALNDRIIQNIGRDARNLQVGHAYFMENEKPINRYAVFTRILREDIFPLLEEYCYEDYETLEKILGNGLVDRNNQRLRHELFDPSRKEDLISALLAPSPEITASPSVLESDVFQENEDYEESDLNT